MYVYSSSRFSSRVDRVRQQTDQAPTLSRWRALPGGKSLRGGLDGPIDIGRFCGWDTRNAAVRSRIHSVEFFPPTLSIS